MLPTISSLTPLNFLWLAVFSLLAFSVQAQKDNSPKCSCYVTAGDVAAYFLYHRFHDFRSIASDPDDDFHISPANITNTEDSGTEPVTSSFFSSETFTNDWDIQTWTQNATASEPVLMVNSAQNVYIARDNATSATYLTLRTSRPSTFQSVSELDSVQTNFFYTSVRIRARITGVEGAVAGLFTYADDDNESDIEILTQDPLSDLRATNQPGVDKNGNEIPSASTDAALPGSNHRNGSLAEWNDYRLDWLPEKSEWFLNGVSAVNKTYGIPRKPSKFVMNMWGDGGEWSGNMTIGGVAMLEVQWVDMVFNISGVGKRKSMGCETVCNIDGVKNVGYPEVVGTTMSSAARLQDCASIFGWVLVVGTTLLLWY
ncbi:hypothetical protein MMC12_007510 [Toensbergia leucococca]|nr:hypothetical protein [Toensbergia leucococca]